jgi:hypothetical protein
MSSQALRRVLAGTLVTTFLSLGSAWQWLTELIFQPDQEITATAAPAGGGSSTDAGWVVDPDG